MGRDLGLLLPPPPYVSSHPHLRKEVCPACDLPRPAISPCSATTRLSGGDCKPAGGDAEPSEQRGLRELAVVLGHGHSSPASAAREGPGEQAAHQTGGLAGAE